MRVIEIVMTSADPDAARVTGEVKAMEEAGTPTVAQVEVRRTFTNTFHARAGRHVLQFRVDRPAKITLHAHADGAGMGAPADFDCTSITAGRRYVFEVPS